ncbi:MAG TPA: twin-arginine translocation signal domain-containing protein [archaeon]|nr:twin-arginine translocation signal domain-containing protein [archaeon]
MTRRRDFIKTAGAGAVLAGLGSSAARADVPEHRWDGYDFGPGPNVTDRLNQGPFGIEQDEGWRNIESTSPSKEPVRNFGLGLVGYTWEEGGPSLAARRGKETLEQHVEKLASLPFVDILYIRCDWRDIQKSPGKLDFHPIWKLTLDAAKTYGLRVGFRIQLSSPNIQPAHISMPDFLHDKVPIVEIGGPPRFDFVCREPRYDHPEFQKAFRELNELLASEFDNNPLVEYMDLMMYGFWGEGHTGDLPNPFPDYLTAEKTMVGMARLQIETWNKVPLAVNTQPDISKTGNREVLDLCVRSGCWLRSDSIVFIEEPIQIECLANRPPWLAVVMEQGGFRSYNINEIPLDEGGVNLKEKSMLHVLDLGANYWSLWTEGENLARYNERYPEGFAILRQRIGYRVRPSWIWQRKRYGTSEVIVAIANDGVAGVPGVLRVYVESPDGKVSVGGGLDAGHPYGGKLRQASFILPKGMEGQKMKVRAEIEIKGVRRPVRWACAQPVNPDGSLTFQLKTFEEKGWRKGV